MEEAAGAETTQDVAQQATGPPDSVSEESFFFRKIAEAAGDGAFDLNLTIRVPEGGALSVMAVLKPTKKGAEFDSVKPLVVTGTPTELDQEFLVVLANAGKTVASAANNLAEYLDAVKKQAEAAKEDASAKSTKRPRASKYGKTGDGEDGEEKEEKYVPPPPPKVKVKASDPEGEGSSTPKPPAQNNLFDGI